MTTPSGPAPNTGRVLEPSKLAIKPQDTNRVYPDGRPDNYGQVNIADRDKSRLGEYPDQATIAHLRSDVDSSKQSQHHTLGLGRNQAAQGDHSHDGLTGNKLGTFEFNPAFDPTLPEVPWPGANWKTRPTLTCAATATDIRALLHNFIEFRDV
jgi:hypothetical protein